VTGSDAVAPPPSRRGRTALRALGVVVVLAAVVAAVAALGGFRAAPVTVPTVRPGTPVDTGQLVITTRAARSLRTDPTDHDEHGRFIGVAFNVTNIAPQTAGTDDMDRLRMTVTGRPGGLNVSALEPDITAGADHRGQQLQPGLPQPVLLVAKLPRGVPVPRELAVTIYRAEFTEGFTDQHRTWRSTGDTEAVVTVPVRPGRS
jgi:hypothetical protein